LSGIGYWVFYSAVLQWCTIGAIKDRSTCEENCCNHLSRVSFMAM
jgi:hypothetical protein